MRYKSSIRRVLPFFTAIAVSTMSAIGIDPDIQLGRTLTQHREKNNEGGTAADELFALPEWRNEMAKKIAKLVVMARDYPNGESRRDEQLKALQRLGDTPEVREMMRKVVNDPLISPGARMARTQLAQIFASLGQLRDARVVPLIAPALREDSKNAFYGDHSVRPPQQLAAQVLYDYDAMGIVKVPGKRESVESSFWRDWWKANRDNFDPVPDGLLAVDEGRARPPTEFEVMAEGLSGPPGQMQQSRNHRTTTEGTTSAAPPTAPTAQQATPVAPVPITPPSLTASSGISFGVAVAAAACCLLLALGIWFYSRTTRP